MQRLDWQLFSRAQEGGPDMFFVDDVLTVDSVIDRRTRSILCRLTCPAGRLVQPGDFLTAAISSRDAQILDVLAQSLQPGASLASVIQELGTEDGGGQSPESGPWDRSRFSLEAVAALKDFQQAIVRGDVPAELHLECLLQCVVGHLPAEDGGAWASLDRSRARELLQRQIEQAAGNSRAFKAPELAEERFTRPDSERDGESVWLATDIPPCESLTYRARTMATSHDSPLDGDPQYEKVFDQLARSLYRSHGHVILVGDPGVGHLVVLAEFARRAAAGRVPFLAAANMLLINCRYVVPEESRDRLLAILARLGNQENIVLCLDGLRSLLRTAQGTSNCNLLLSALQRARCRVIGVLGATEYEESFATNPDAIELFTKVSLHEPEIPVAERIVNCCLAGLIQRFTVEFDEHCVRTAVVLSANYILNERLPGKALKLLRRVCERVDYERTQLGRESTRVTPAHIFERGGRLQRGA